MSTQLKVIPNLRRKNQLDSIDVSLEEENVNLVQGEFST